MDDKCIELFRTADERFRRMGIDTNDSKTRCDVYGLVFALIMKYEGTFRVSNEMVEAGSLYLTEGIGGLEKVSREGALQR